MRKFLSYTVVLLLVLMAVVPVAVATQPGVSCGGAHQWAQNWPPVVISSTYTTCYTHANCVIHRVETAYSYVCMGCYIDNEGVSVSVQHAQSMTP